MFFPGSRSLIAKILLTIKSCKSLRVPRETGGTFRVKGWWGWRCIRTRDSKPGRCVGGWWGIGMLRWCASRRWNAWVCLRWSRHQSHTITAIIWPKLHCETFTMPQNLYSITNCKVIIAPNTTNAIPMKTHLTILPPTLVFKKFRNHDGSFLSSSAIHITHKIWTRTQNPHARKKTSWGSCATNKSQLITLLACGRKVRRLLQNTRGVTMDIIRSSRLTLA